MIFARESCIWKHGETNWIECKKKFQVRDYTRMVHILSFLTLHFAFVIYEALRTTALKNGTFSRETDKIETNCICAEKDTMKIRVKWICYSGHSLYKWEKQCRSINLKSVFSLVRDAMRLFVSGVNIQNFVRLNR